MEERSEAVNCLSIQGEVGGEKRRRGRREARGIERKRGNMRRYNERGKRKEIQTEYRGIKADKPVIGKRKRRSE